MDYSAQPGTPVMVFNPLSWERSEVASGVIDFEFDDPAAWDFALVNLTDAMGVINLSGPNARRVLAKVVDIDLSNEAFPFSGYREFFIKDTIFVRAMRLGFVGELSYELHVPSSYMQAVWDMLKDAGAEFGIRNFGVEAQNVLRMEKGHVILGSESEQRTNLIDLGLGFLWDRKKTDAKTVGAVALHQAESDVGRLKLDEWLIGGPKDFPGPNEARVGGPHHMCTTRMSDSPRQGVVDRVGRTRVALVHREAEARLDGDTWIVTIDGAEVYEVPRALIEGG